jgi:hypothetical protein
MLDVEMLRVTELVVRVMRVAGVAVAGRNDNGIVLSEVIGELVLGSAVGPEAVITIIVRMRLTPICGGVVVVRSHEVSATTSIVQGLETGERGHPAPARNRRRSVPFPARAMVHLASTVDLTRWLWRYWAEGVG